MPEKSHWPVIAVSIEVEDDAPRFLTQEEWATLDAAVGRIYPADHDPGAREARVVRFIDRYLSGLGYVFASPDGKGFLAMSGREADAWRARISTLQCTYREGLARTDRIAQSEFGQSFRALSEHQQDRVLELLSGLPKPVGLADPDEGPAATHVQNIGEDGMAFFDMLTLHVRQGMFGDPVYGGNKDRVGWTLIGFPGPRSLADTRDCSFSLKDHFNQDVCWADLIPHLAEDAAVGGSHDV